MFYTSFLNSHARIHVHKHAGPYRSCSATCSKLNITHPPPPSLLSSPACPHLPQLLCAQHPFSTFFKFAKKHHRKVLTCLYISVYIDLIFFHIHMPRFPPQPCVTVSCFLKLLGLTHTSALAPYFFQRWQQNAIDSFPTANRVANWERTTRVCLVFSAHLGSGS